MAKIGDRKTKTAKRAQTAAPEKEKKPDKKQETKGKE